MKRAEIEKEFTIKDGAITEPGKFEGEAIYAPHFWEASMDGCAEELSWMEDGCGEYACLVEVSPEDREEFPQIDGKTAFMLVTESDQGFVGCRELTRSEAEKARAEYAEQQTEESEEESR